MHIFNPLSVDRQASPEARRVLWLLMVASFFLQLGFAAWNSLFNNFAADELLLGADQVGMIQGLREIPGLLGFVLGWIVMLIPEMRLIGLCVVLLGGGLVLMSQTGGYWSLLVATMIMSVGFHFYESSRVSLALTFTRKEVAPRVLGALASIGAVASMLGTSIVLLLALPLGYRPLIVLLGAVTFVGGMAVTVLSNQGRAERLPRKVIFRKRYWLYYVLTFLMGSRRHIFSTFAIFLLVSEFHVNVQQSAALFLFNSIATTLAYPQIGRLVARLGERTILTINFAVLTVVFVGYAYLRWVPILVLFFMFDNILFGFALSINTYFHKIAVTPEEITSNVSMAQTINHLSAVFVPALGGLIWRLYGYQATFMAGTAIALAALILTQWVKVERPATAATGVVES